MESNDKAREGEEGEERRACARGSAHGRAFPCPCALLSPAHVYSVLSPLPLSSLHHCSPCPTLTTPCWCDFVVDCSSFFVFTLISAVWNYFFDFRLFLLRPCIFGLFGIPFQTRALGKKAARRTQKGALSWLERRVSVRGAEF